LIVSEAFLFSIFMPRPAPLNLSYWGAAHLPPHPLYKGWGGAVVCPGAWV